MKRLPKSSANLHPKLVIALGGRWAGRPAKEGLAEEQRPGIPDGVAWRNDRSVLAAIQTKPWRGAPRAHPANFNQALGSPTLPRSLDSARQRSAMLARLCIGRNSSTYGNIARTPSALG